MMNVRKDLVVKRIPLSGQSRGCLFRVDFLNGNHICAGHAADMRPKAKVPLNTSQENIGFDTTIPARVSRLLNRTELLTFVFGPSP